MRFESKVALVTGGAGGIGGATASRLAAEGARVAVGDLDGDAARELAGDLGGVGLELDVRSAESIAAAVAAAEQQLGPIDVLVNNAGVAGELFFTQTPPEVWDNMLAVNLRGVLAMTHAVLPGMHARGGGAIVNVASEAGRVGSQLSVVYSATKAGVIGFTKALAKESARFGVRVNAVAPGPIDTQMVRAAEVLGEIGERMVQGMIDSTVMKRLGEPDEVAAAIAWLASDEASYVTGETVGVSGGLGMM
ncbi:MAG TPA: SDR family oxidoreductase [Thermoleophilaceae bacterium]|nr:SDR family oxidoreductase [Thermoleophilaceae bacterium]